MVENMLPPSPSAVLGRSVGRELRGQKCLLRLLRAPPREEAFRGEPTCLRQRHRVAERSKDSPGSKASSLGLRLPGQPAPRLK